MSLRKKIANSEWLNNSVARLIAGYIRLAHRTSRWEKHGFEPLDQAVDNGEAMICTLWHDRLVMTPYFFPHDRARACSITSDARAGTMVGRIQMLFGMETIRMSSHQRHVALSRQVIEKIKEGCSIGIAVDGPRGPSREAKIVPLMWARTTGKRVFMITYSVKHAGRLPAWDRMLLPRPFTSGVFLCREFSAEIPRRLGAEQMESLRKQLEDEMNALSAEADAKTGFVS